MGGTTHRGRKAQKLCCQATLCWLTVPSRPAGPGAALHIVALAGLSL